LHHTVRYGTAPATRRPPLFVTLLAVTFLIAAAVTTIVGRLFQRSIVAILVAIVAYGIVRLAANRGTEAAA